ncbi:hypothetical protein HPP92_022724 [Vanilla planifolia]|uniref:Uncharacterized protein n=1 Tax=Vanilla planifolia TaxID=51239 RepID=A0A835UDG3_VANPL|nr:hypothetical protein HPP92_022724 [Vanilla planifolia]
MSSRQLDFKKSFQISIQSVLAAFSKEDVHGAFPKCTNSEKESLYHLLIQVTRTLHENLEEQFESTCRESQVLAAFDKIEQLVEEQKLDILYANETKVLDAKDKLLKVKMDELQHLKSLLQKVEEQNSSMETKIQSLERRQDSEEARNAVAKLWIWNSILHGKHRA